MTREPIPTSAPTDAAAYYGVRIVAYGLIIAAIVIKNRKSS